MSASAELGGVVARDEVVGLGEQKGTTEQEDERWSRKVAN
jgi:hypothetical protein